MESGLNTCQPPPENESAPHTLLILAALQLHDPLTYPDLSLDHPIERSAGGDLRRPLGVIARPMLRRLRALALPRRQILDAVAADAELDEMEHDVGPKHLLLQRGRPQRILPARPWKPVSDPASQR